MGTLMQVTAIQKRTEEPIQWVMCKSDMVHGQPYMYCPRTADAGTIVSQ